MSNKSIIKVEGIKDAPALLQNFELRRSKLVAFAGSLKEKAKKGLTPELDKTLMEFINAAKKTGKEFNEKRSPFTREIDRIKKMFVTEENYIKAEITEIQRYRDAYAKQVHDENAKARRKADLERLKADELIDLKSKIDIGVSSSVRTIIDNMKSAFTESLKSVTKENADAKLEKLMSLSGEMPDKKYQAITINLKSEHGHNVDNLLKNCLTSKMGEHYKQYRTEFDDFRRGAIGIINDVKAGEDKTDSIKAAEDQAKIDTAQAMEIAEVVADTAKEAQQAEVAFASSMAVVKEAPEAREAYEIVVSDMQGYASLNAYWWNVCGPAFKGQIKRKTIGSMMKDLEKHAHKTGEMLESGFVTYNEVFRAVNRA